mmetsp:Transcript_30715/g.57229  ORF Transcript_30715/g.57229 Transcript_30715/m.57229 type:complete len:1157 (+) Transcript_30715:61-3531(+)
MIYSFKSAIAALLMTTATSTFLRGDDVATKPTVGDQVRKLLVDADRRKRCFEDGNSQGLRNPHDADYYENPWLRNNDRGDWGKCLPEEVFGVLCVHEDAHGVNDGTHMPMDGPLHDGPAQQLFLKLQQLHNDYCVHVDVKIPDSVQESFNDFFFARHAYAISDMHNDHNSHIGHDHTDGEHTDGGDMGGDMGHMSASSMDMEDPVHHHDMPISHDMACVQTYPDDPRMALQMSLYCLLGYIEESIDTSIVHRDYGLSPACDTIVRHNMRHQFEQEVVFPPHMFCESDTAANTCRVHADVRTDGINTCEKYCEKFENLECKAAAVNSWSDQCTAQRPWSCTEPTLDSNLMCTCGAKATPFVSSDHVTTSCAKQLLPSDHPPNRFCSQDFEADTCTTVSRLNNLETGTCTEYCGLHDLSCVAAHEDSNCVGYKEYSCNASSSSYMLCTCGPSTTPAAENLVTTVNCDNYCGDQGKVCLSASSTPEENCMLSDGIPCSEPDDFATVLEYVCGADIERPDTVEAMSTASCEHMMFYRDPVSRAVNFCPPQTIPAVADVADSCTVLASVNSVGGNREERTCDAYCNTFEGMKCVGAAEEVRNDCNVKWNLQCDQPYSSSTSDLLCACAIDDAKMAAAQAARDTEISPACENMMLSPSRDTGAVDRVCESFPTENTCTVLATVQNLPSRTCNEFCSSYHEMECVAAAKDKWSSCNVDKEMTCDEVTTDRNILCTCGFKDGANRSSYMDLAPVFEPNAVRSCPAYKVEANTEGNDYYTNEADRKYKMVELTLDIDEHGTGAASVTDINVRVDRDNSDIDTYNTAHVEACDGFESQIRPGDPDEKCSFGHRLDKSQNCYGKVYGQNYEEASAACAERGGHIVRIDDQAEFDLLESIFGAQSFNIGLHDSGGRDWEWDGYSGVVDTDGITFATLNDNKRDCLQLNLGNGQLNGKYCYERETYMCEGIRNSTTGLGGDLMADEGGFCLWYLADRNLELPDDESGGFKNTELANFLLFDEDLRTRKYIEVNGKYYDADNIPGYPPNEVNWDEFTYRKLGIDSDEPLVDKDNHDKYFHCHYSPTNFGMARIYIQQHMLERIYPGSMHKHCFCGYKHLGHFVSRCDCTRSGERNGQCQKHHRTQLATETYLETGEYVYCNNGNCENASP